MIVHTPRKSAKRPTHSHSYRKPNAKPSHNLSVLHHSSVTSHSPRVQISKNFESTIRNRNPELSLSGKNKRCYQMRATSKRTGNRVGRLQNQIPEFAPLNHSVYIETTVMDRRNHENTLRSSILRELTDQTEKQRLVQELQMNSLELFRFSEKNMEKRIKLLKKYQQKLAVSWKSLLNVLKTSDNKDQEVINQSVKSLVGQRLLFEKQIQKGRMLLDQLRL